MTNREYQIIRDSLIPQATKHADRECGADRKLRKAGVTREAWAWAWNRTYFKKMDELVKTAISP